MLLIDVRTPAEFASGHLEGAINLDIAQANFLDQVKALPKGKDCVVYCHSGSRSAFASQLMSRAGMGSIQDLGSLHMAALVTNRKVVTS